MNIKFIFLFVSGLVIGGAAGVLGTKKHFKDKYEKLYEEDHELLEEYYQRINGKYSEGDQKEENNEADFPNETDSVPGGRMTPEERKAVKERLNKNLGGTNYAAIYSGGQTKIESVGGVTESFCEDVALSFSSYDTDEEAFDEHQKNKNKYPKIISAEAYEDLPAYIEQQTLYFWAFDEMLADENEEPVEEPERLIGDALTKYGFADGPERLIFVMNYAQDVCYEVQKLDASWTDTH